MANLEKLAATIAVPSYAIDDQTAIKVIYTLESKPILA